MGHCADWKLPPCPGSRAEHPEWWDEHDRWRKAYNTCSECGSMKVRVWNHSAIWHDGDVYCENGHYVRMWDAG